MRRRAVLGLLPVCLLATVVPLLWPGGPSASILEARSRYGKLRIGMPAADAEGVLGVPRRKDKLYGEWFDATHWYATIHPKDCPNPSPGMKLYDWYQWDFGGRGGWTSEAFWVGALLDRGRVVCFWYGEDRQTLAERAYKRNGWRFGIDTSTYSTVRTGHSHEHRTTP
jgi:hypothetical protein